MPEDLDAIANRTKALIFDFDGTLVDSNPIKINAFQKCFADFPNQLEAIMGYCREHHHTPRMVKFRHVYAKILRRPLTREIEKKLLDCYAEATTQHVIHAPALPGSMAFVKKWAAQKRTALLSSTPHGVLLHILRERGMLSYFSAIQGAPVCKESWIRQYCEVEGLPSKEVVFLGDTAEDAQSAKQAGVGFVLVHPELFLNGHTHDNR